MSMLVLFTESWGSYCTQWIALSFAERRLQNNCFMIARGYFYEIIQKFNLFFKFYIIILCWFCVFYFSIFFIHFSSVTKQLTHRNSLEHYSFGSTWRVSLQKTIATGLFILSWTKLFVCVSRISSNRRENLCALCVETVTMKQSCNRTKALIWCIVLYHFIL